eukprot:2398109-Pyramimonas_sp.AAC.1
MCIRDRSESGVPRCPVVSVLWCPVESEIDREIGSESHREIEKCPAVSRGVPWWPAVSRDVGPPLSPPQPPYHPRGGRI